MALEAASNLEIVNLTDFWSILIMDLVSLSFYEC